MLDVGCGYGRDTRYLAAELGCRVLGLDPSPAAVDAARKAAPARALGRRVHAVVATRRRFAGGRPPTRGRFDVVFACNVYHLLGPDRPPGVRGGAARRRPARRPPLPQHAVAARPAALRRRRAGLGEERSWVDKVYLHFCTADELDARPRGFELLDLDERSYEEPQPRRRAPPHELVPGGAPALSLRLAGAGTEAPLPSRRRENGLTTRSGPNARPCWKSSLYSVRQPPGERGLHDESVPERDRVARTMRSIALQDSMRSLESAPGSDPANSWAASRAVLGCDRGCSPSVAGRDRCRTPA